MSARTIELSIDVTEAAGLGSPAHTAVTVHLPAADALVQPPVVCFAFPGGGYSRHYWAMDLDDSGATGQAGFHTDRGWIFVSCDHLGVGDSTVVEPDTLDYEDISRANAATVRAVVGRLEQGTLDPDVQAIDEPTVIGIGQSMGGCLTIVAQAHHRCFDAIGILGFSAIQTIVPSQPGMPPLPMPWVTRASSTSDPMIVNAGSLTAVEPAADTSAEHPWTWAFHHDDEPRGPVETDMAAMTGGANPPWRSATVPACAIKMVAPGTVATEAAAIDVPILLAVGERDVVPDPMREPTAYRSASDITMIVTERMAHMHAFAPTREQQWSRLHRWGTGIAGDLSD